MPDSEHEEVIGPQFVDDPVPVPADQTTPDFVPLDSWHARENLGMLGRDLEDRFDIVDKR
jgi:hypothetical protein